MSSVAPPPEEQNRISAFLETQGHMTAKAVLQQEQLVTLVKEHRKFLIGDVVTGKLDVREAARGLLDIDHIDDGRASNSSIQMDALCREEVSAAAYARERA